MQHGPYYLVLIFCDHFAKHRQAVIFSNKNKPKLSLHELKLYVFEVLIVLAEEIRSIHLL